MAFRKRKHFSSGPIVVVAWLLMMTTLVHNTTGLQGLPTWMCLGVSSPFINLRNGIEVLSNKSISLNITKDEQALMHQEGLNKLGTIIKPVDLRDPTTGYVKHNYTKTVPKATKSLHPIEEEMNRKQIIILDEDTDENGLPLSLTEEDKKFIVPIATRNFTRPAAATTAALPSTTRAPMTTMAAIRRLEPPSSIDDLKNHILFLQNMTKHNSNFQSKFVVFPGLKSEPTTTTARTTPITRRTTTTTTTQRTTTTKKISIIPQVLLLNDQTPPDPEDEYEFFRPRPAPSGNKNTRVTFSKRKNIKNPAVTQIPGAQQRRVRKKKPCKNPSSRKCQRRMQEAADQPAFVRAGNATGGERRLRTIRSHKRKSRISKKPSSDVLLNDDGSYELAMKQFERRTKFLPNDTMFTDNGNDIDLNPEHCHGVEGFTNGQKKFCVYHTNVMPAISRGARSAIQECQHQFKDRRWNCSTVLHDSSVFGPITSLGAPEIAFIHALASATVTSFIARACRDGQLTSCGCSRGARPKQLHDDWTWGGCGDDLEYAYKVSQNFIDIREKERRRDTRGIVTVSQDRPLPPNQPPQPQPSANATSEPAANGTQPNPRAASAGSPGPNANTLSSLKQDSLLQLQERITKEILNSKLQEKEMYELKEKINREILNSKVFSLDDGPRVLSGRLRGGVQTKAKSLMNLHNNEAGRLAVIKKTRITCKCHGVSGSCSLITCWQQLSSIREIGDYLREKYDEAVEVKLTKRGRLQVRDASYKAPTAHDLVYLDESPDWCRANRQLKWPGTHGRVCNKTSSGLNGCGILCCGRGYNTRSIVVRERCNCRFHWCCQVKCEVCVKVLEEHTCK